MKHKDFKPCVMCGKGVMHSGSPLFLRINVERFGIDRRAVERAHGMELIIGNPTLANIMGPDEDLAKEIDSQKDMLLCHPCALEPLPPNFWVKDTAG